MEQKYGALLTPDIKLHRTYFKEMCSLIGIKVIYRAPRPSKTYTTYAEIDSNYCEPKLVGCIFEENPSQQTLKKLGWMSELETSAAIISVPYDLEGLQQGALFIVPSGLDNAKGRLFRVSKMSTIAVYPSSITCEIVPEYVDEFPQAQAYDYKDGSLNILNTEEEHVIYDPNY